MSIVLVDSFSGNDLCEFVSEKKVLNFLKREFWIKCKLEKIKDIIQSQSEYAGYKWRYGKSKNEYPRLIIISYRNSKKIIDDFLSAINKYCKKGKYIIHYEGKIVEEFYTQPEVGRYFGFKNKQSVFQYLKKGFITNKTSKIKYNFEKVNMIPFIEFELLDFTTLLKYAKQYKEDNSYIDLLVNLDVEGLDYE